MNNNNNKEKYYLFCAGGEYILNIDKDRKYLDDYWSSDICYMLDCYTDKEHYKSIEDFENHLTYYELSIDEIFLTDEEYREVKKLIRHDPYVANEYIEYDLPDSERRTIQEFRGDFFDWNDDTEEKEKIIAYLKNKELALL